jgi:glycosyltransferase involved in cell wall biosynthesis
MLADIPRAKSNLSSERSEVMLPSISVVTPSFNQERFVERTILSVLNQEIPGLEYVVIDGGSTDETVNILKQYEDRLRWVSEKDNGQADAVNKGIKATRGEIIGWLNSDDIYYPGALAAVLAFFEKHPEADVVYGDADHIDIDDGVIEPYYTEDWNYERLKEICFLCQPAVFFRRRVTEREGLLDDRHRYCMDYEFWLRLGASIPFIRINRKLAGSRMYDDNKTLGSRVAVHREMNDMLRQSLGSVPDKWIYNYAHAVVDRKGYKRTTPKEDLKYVFMLVGVSIFTFARWRHSLPLNAMRDMGKWLGASLRNVMRMFVT